MTGDFAVDLSVYVVLLNALRMLSKHIRNGSVLDDGAPF